MDATTKAGNGNGAADQAPASRADLMMSALRVAFRAPLLGLRATIAEMQRSGEADLAVMAERIERADQQIGESLEASRALVNNAAKYRDLREFMALPETLGDALMAEMLSRQISDDALLRWAHAASVVIKLDDESGRLRRKCANAIQKEHIESSPSNTKPIADTPLDKMAGDHPEYVAHREALAEAKQREKDCEAEKEIAANRLKAAGRIVTGFLAESRSLSDLLADIQRREQERATAAGSFGTPAPSGSAS